MMPRVSVIIPTFNRARDLERALASVLGQTFNDIEVIVVDNHSTDDPAAVIARHNDARISLHQIDNGGIVAKSRNLGIQVARGEYVAFLDSDDWWAPRKLAASVEVLDRGADVVYHHLYLATRVGQVIFPRKVRARDLRSPVLRDLLDRRPAIPQSSVVMRRAVLSRIGGVPEDSDLVAMEDFACWVNAARVTERFTRVRGTLGYYWAGGGNLSSDARTLELLDRFEARYAADMGVLPAATVPAWVSYARGRAYYRMGDSSRANRHLSLASTRTAPWGIRIKALITRAGNWLWRGRELDSDK